MFYSGEVGSVAAALAASASQFPKLWLKANMEFVGFLQVLWFPSKKYGSNAMVCVCDMPCRWQVSCPRVCSELQIHCDPDQNKAAQMKV